MSTVTAEKSIYEQKALEKANFKVKGRFNPKYSLYSVSITLGSLSGFKMKDLTSTQKKHHSMCTK